MIRMILALGFISPGLMQTPNGLTEIPGLNFPCISCHTNTGWTELTLTGFDHDSTGFPLQDSHESLNCRDCHPGKSLLEIHQFGNASDQCRDCHTDIHSGQLGPDCKTCHTPANWLTNRDGFRHELTIFPLAGNHRGVDCGACHPTAQEGVYRGVSLICADCHQAENTLADGVVMDHGLFSDQCEYCHGPADWKPPEMDHSRTGYPLVGRHTSTSCSLCHTAGYVNTVTECFVCHLDAYTLTTEPIHIQQIYPLTDCQKCHDPRSWTRSIYDHYPPPENCSLCHLKNWFAANQTIIGHLSLPNQCQSCHVISAWNEFLFDHSITSYELSGMHLTAACSGCHSDGFYLTPTECADCHMENFEDTTRPSHTDNGYDPDECETCHSPLAWEPAIFHDPSKVSICSDCHNYNGISDPLPVLDHSSAGKLGDQINHCTFCHQNARDWKDTNMPRSVHDDSDYGIYFNIFSGTHSGRWGDNCSGSCHVFGRFDTFSCYDNCHAGIHSRSQSRDRHCEGNSNCEDCNGSNGYWLVNQTYTDGNWDDPDTFQMCYECHPNGNMSGGCANDIAKPFDPRTVPADPGIKDKITK